MDAIAEGAEYLATQDVRKLLGSLIATKFNFRTQMVTCVEKLKTQEVRIATYGVVVDKQILCLIILANCE